MKGLKDQECTFLKAKFNRTYIFIFGFSNMVAGGPIYNRNKIIYLKERGWNVVVFPTSKGKVYISGLEEYKGYCFDFFNV